MASPAAVSPREHIFSEALTMSETERAQLAKELLESLSPPSSTLHEDDPEFIAELRRRSERVERGQSTARSWDEFYSELQERLRTR